MKALTAEQKRKVKSLIEDEGQSRAEAIAWVRAFEAGEPRRALEGLSETGNDLATAFDAPLPHTPGPWGAFPINSSGTISIVAKPNILIATMADGRFDALTDADARLIVAAPTMLELLRALVPFAESRAEDMLEIADPDNGSIGHPEQQAEALERALLVERAKDLLAEVES